MALRETRARQDCQVSTLSQAALARRETADSRVIRAEKVCREPKVPPVCRDAMESKEKPVCREFRDSKEDRVCQAATDCQATTDCPVLRVSMVNRAPRDRQDSTDRRVDR